MSLLSALRLVKVIASLGRLSFLNYYKLKSLKEHDSNTSIKMVVWSRAVCERRGRVRQLRGWGQGRSTLPIPAPRGY